MTHKEEMREAWKPSYIIVYEDASVENEYFGGHGAEECALRRYEQISGSWNARLFRECKRNWHETERYEAALASKPDAEALQRFKDYVHKRLDNAGIPTHPEGEHSKAGCRIGDRLDIVLASKPVMPSEDEAVEIMAPVIHDNYWADEYSSASEIEREGARQQARHAYRALLSAIENKSHGE